jgi:phosphoribosylformimino-5-aminoimidazole carboxamide ribotide isomerase
MLIYPALDLLDGKCVRLRKGDFEQKTVYSEDPSAMVRIFENVGARFLHLVDLSGAKDPGQRQLSLIRKLVAGSRLRIQCGGGIRSAGDLDALFDCGVDRAVLGSVAVTRRDLTGELLARYGGARLTLAVDVVPVERGEYRVAIEGWKKITGENVFDFISSYAGHEDLRVLCTDISRDGMLTGPNLVLYRELTERFPGIDIQASGGVAREQDLEALERGGVRSAIVGKAIYEETIPLGRLRC